MISEDRTDFSQSINSIIRSHPRERLYVRPQHWNHRHLRLLNCGFVNDEAPLPTTARSNCNDGDGIDGNANEDILKLINRFSAGCTLGWKEYACARILHEHIGLQTRQERLKFYYDNRSFILLHCSLFFWSSETDDRPSLSAYVDYMEILKRRPKFNAWRIANKKPDWSQDPAVLPILISLAQEQRNSERYHATADLDVYTSQLLMTCDYDCQTVRLYEAEIPVGLLNKLADPNCPGTAKVVIKHREIAFAPRHDFLDRLATALKTQAKRECEAGINDRPSERPKTD